MESGANLGAGDGVAGIPAFRQPAYSSCLLWKQRAPTQTQVHIKAVLDGDSATEKRTAKDWGRGGLEGVRIANAELSRLNEAM